MEFTRLLFPRYPAPVCDAGRIGGTEHVPRGLREARLLLRGRLWRTLGRRGGLGCRQRGEGRTCPRAVRSTYLSSRLSLQRLHHANLKHAGSVVIRCLRRFAPKKPTTYDNTLFGFGSSACVVLTNACRVLQRCETQARGVVRGLRNEEFVLKPGKGQVVCGSERVVDEVCAALAAADGE